ncbi:MAG: Gfo/Idh/MocA family oxidoreductase [Rhodothermales bacterium]
MSERELSRRDFIATGAAAATALSGIPFVHTSAARRAPIRVGVVGTGGRGTGACANALMADPEVEIVAMAEIGRDRVDQSLQALKEAGDLQDPSYQDRIKVTDDTIFIGPDAFKEVMAMDLDYVILTTPPGFRPLHFEEAVNRGLHVFAEKPVATDPAGCRRIRASAQKARRQGLNAVVGLQGRYDLATRETMKRVHDGAIGEILSGTVHRMGGWLWHRGDEPDWSPMEYQMRNWYYHCWLSGDQIVEMVIHQIDRINWTLDAVPLSAVGQGGRIQRSDPKWGNIWDNMTVDFEYPDDVHVHLMNRQWESSENINRNRVIGTLGETDTLDLIRGENRWRYPDVDDLRHIALVNEHMELISAIRNGETRNDMLDYAIDSTLTGIMGREAAYTGRRITWEEISSSDLDLFPESYQFGPAPERPVPVPGKARPV